MPTNPFLTRSILPDPDKWADAACVAWGEPELWFVDDPRHRDNLLAVKICDGCPVKNACRAEFADEGYGVFGGTTPGDRFPGRNRVRCGTKRGYRRHVRVGEEPCEECTARMGAVA